MSGVVRSAKKLVNKTVDAATDFGKKVVNDLIPNEVLKPIKAVVDPVIDFATGAFKGIVDTITGAFSLPDFGLNIPDLNFDTAVGNAEIKAATTFSYNGANRAIPVLYGQQIDIAPIPVWANTWGDNSADTSKQYLYVAAVISQGFHGSNQSIGGTGSIDPCQGSLLARLLLDGRPVHLGGLSSTSNANYSEGGATFTRSDGGVYASGKGGVQPTTYTITKGTFANRLKIQYFDGSSDQPASSLLSEHPEWGNNKKLSGLHYIALRLELKAADEVVGGSDGNGTFPNPYTNIPTIICQVSGRSTPNIVSGKTSDPGYEERFQTAHADTLISSRFMSYHKPIKTPIFNGDLDAFDGTYNNAVEKLVIPVDSDTQLQVKRFLDFQPLTFDNGVTQPFNIHNKLEELQWTYDYVFFFPGRVTGSYNSDSTSVSTTYGGSSDATDAMLWLENIGGSHYKIVSKINRDLTTTITSGEVTLFGYNSEAGTILNSLSPSNLNLSSATAVYRFYSEDNILESIRKQIEHFGYAAKLRVRNRFTGSNQVFDIQGMDYNSGDAYIDFSIVNEDSSAVSTNFYSTVDLESDIYVEIFGGSTNTTKTPLSWDLSFANGYLTEGLVHQGYRCDNNVAEYILDYLLNPNYGVGLDISQIDRRSFYETATALDRVPNYFDFSNKIFAMGVGLTDIFGTGDPIYCYGENATTVGDGNRIVTNANGYDRQFVVNTGRGHLENVNIMLSSIGAYMPLINGKFHLKLENAGDPEDSERIKPKTAIPIQAVLTEDNIIGSVSLATTNLNDRLNSIKIDYTELTTDSQPNTVLVPDPETDSTQVRQSYLDEDNGKVLETTFAQPGIFDPSTASKYGAMLLKKSRGQPIVTFQCNFVGIKFTPGDFVRLKLISMRLNDLFLITDVTVNYDNTATVVAIRHVPEFYDMRDDAELYQPRQDILTYL